MGISAFIALLLGGAGGVTCVAPQWWVQIYLGQFLKLLNRFEMRDAIEAKDLVRL